MSGKQAKKLRKQIYGADYSPRHRNYIRTPYGIQAIGRRQEYQRAKKRGRAAA